MKAQDQPETETVYEVYLIIDKKRHLCNRYKRQRDALNLYNTLSRKYVPLGYEVKIDLVEIAPAGSGLSTGSHNVGTPPQEQGNPPTE